MTTAATRTGLGTGCHRDYFTFADSTGAIVRYPTTGSLAVGPSDGTCPTWDASLPAACASPRGDADGDGVVAANDVVWLINSVFAGGAPTIGNGDANADNSTNAVDVFSLINYLFAGGPAPPG